MINKIEERKEFSELKETEKFLKEYFLKEGIKGKIIISARKAAYLFLQLGPAFSHRVVYFREIGMDPDLFSQSVPGLMIYTNDLYKYPLPATLFFSRLSLERKCFIVNRIKGERYKLMPRFFSSTKKVIICEIIKIKTKKN